MLKSRFLRDPNIYYRTPKMLEKRQIKKHYNRNCSADFHGGPGRIRTCDLLIRSQTLYPTELQSHKCFTQATLIV